MRIVEINSCNFGSTGNIMLSIAQVARAQGHAVYTACPDGRSMRKKELEHHMYIGGRISRNLHLKLAYWTGYNDCFSIVSTKGFLKRLDALRPDIIHLHNLHNCYLNLRLLFEWIKKRDVKVIWTLHDCWAFTAQCPHFTFIRCGKWKTGCYECPQHRSYPPTYADRTKTLWELKKKWFTGVRKMTLVTPSQWLAGLVKQSFLKDYPVKVIHNGIDVSVFQPTPGNFRQKHGISPSQHIVLGVAAVWGIRKGEDVFMALAQRLDSSRYRIVLVGMDDAASRQLPLNIIAIHRTHNRAELAEIYTAADVFVQPTREEAFGLVNSEALACGTPVITFDAGGSPETIDETCGSVVACDDVDALVEEIQRVCENRPYGKEACIKRARAFHIDGVFQQYVSLYEGGT